MKENIPMNDINFDESKFHVDSIAKLLTIASGHIYTEKFAPQKWLYRGESNYDYKYSLRPSIGRLKDNDTFRGNEEILLKFEKQAFDHFLIRAANEIKYNNDFIYLAAAQHHGLKTRLLDWSLNLLAALYFAVEDDKIDTETSKVNDGALYAFQIQEHYRFNDFPKGSSPLTVKKSDFYFINTPYVSARIKAQQGVFQLFTNPFQSLNKAFNLIKLRIKAKNKTSIKRQLYEMGIHAESLFPDLDGICKSINYYSLNL